jgi:hypothetical protein
MGRKTRGTTAAIATINSTAATAVAAYDPARQAVRIYNDTGVSIRVAMDATATSSLGELVVAGETWITEEFAASAISVISVSGSSLTVQVTT